VFGTSEKDMTTKEELPGLIKDIYIRAKASKDKYSRDWRLNDAFIKGYQNVAFMPVTNALYVPSKPKGRVRLIENHCQEIYLALISILTSGRPNVFVAPSSSEPDDVRDARAQQTLADFMWDDLKANKLLQQAVAYGIITNRMIIKVFWNNYKGDPIEVPRTTEVIAQLVENVIQEKGIENVSPDSLPGDIFFENIEPGYIDAYVVNPHSFYVEPHVKDWQSARRVIETHVYHINDAAEIWPEIKDMKGNVSSWEMSNGIDKLEDPFMYQYDTSSLDQKKDLVLVIEYFELPSKKYKNGRWAVICEDKVLDYKEECKVLPYVTEQLILDNFNFWGDISKIRTAIPLQMELNKTISQIIEHKNNTIFPHKYFSIESGLDPETFDDSPGRYHEINDIRFKPTADDPVQLMPEVYTLPDQLRKMIADAVGLHGVTRGEAESGLASGRAIAFMAEKDQQKFAHLAKNIEDLYMSFTVNCMKLWHAHMPVAKTITVMGKDMAWESISFQSNQIKSYNVFVRPFSMMMSSRALQNDLIVQLMTAQLIPPDAGVKLMEFGNVQMLWGNKDVDSAWAKQENVIMMNGQVPQPHWWENHPVHYDVVVEYMKSTDYQLLPDKLKVVFEQHAQMHVQYMQQAAQQQAAMMAGGQPGGQPGAKPTPDQGASMGQAQGKQTTDQTEENVLRMRAGL